MRAATSHGHHFVAGDAARQPPASPQRAGHPMPRTKPLVHQLTKPLVSLPRLLNEQITLCYELNL
jgi:hypothetical protein